MKKLIVLRHAEFDGIRLTQNGLLVFGRLVEKLQPEWDGASVSIISAPSVRVQQTAQIIASKTNGSITVVNDLDGEGFSSPSNEQWKRILALIMGQTSDVVIAVMHREETEIMSGRVIEMLLTREQINESDFHYQKLDHNNAYILDLNQKKVQHVWVKQ